MSSSTLNDYVRFLRDQIGYTWTYTIFNSLFLNKICFIRKKGITWFTNMVEEEKNDNEAPKEGEEK